MRSVVFSVDNIFLMLISYSEVKIWNFSIGFCFWIIDFGYGICSLIVLKSKYGIVGMKSGIFEIIDIGSVIKVEDVEVYGGIIWLIVFILDDIGFVIVSVDYEVKFWEY